MHGWEAYFVRAGYEVHLLTWHQPDVPSSAEESGVQIHYLPAQGPLNRRGLRVARSFWAGLYIRSLVSRYSIDLVHAHQVIPYGFWAALSGVRPLVLTAWGSDLLTEPYASPRAMRYTKYALHHADLLTADSDHLRKAAVALGCRAPTQVVQLGVDTDVYKPGDKVEARRWLGFDPTAPLVLSPRALSPVYNIETILASVPLVLREVPTANYVLKYGYAAGREDAVRQRINELGLADKVRMEGFTGGNSMVAYYVAADVCVSVASSDSSPKSVLEAMACGTPVVLSDLPWVHERIADEHEALLIPPRDPAALAAATTRLLKDATLRATLSEAGRCMVVEHADYHQSMAEMDRLYRQLGAKRKT